MTEQRVVLNLDQRLDLILEAIKYCRKVRTMGMPPSCYTKSLREPVYFLWEMRNTSKKVEAARYRSLGSINYENGKGQIIYDHAIPFVLLQRKLLDGGFSTRADLMDLLQRYCVACLITKQEDDALNKAGLMRKMPEGWDEVDCLARYHAAGIALMDNPHYRSDHSAL